jgi:hypothetical protein
MLAGALLLAGCAPGPVDVPPPSPDPPAAAACRRLHAALPATVDGLDRRPTTPASELTEAWGSPAVVLRCGVPRPAALQPTSQLFSANGVDWLPVEGAKAWTFTTIGRVALVEVVVPKRHDPAVGPLVDLAGPITQAVPPVTAGRSAAAAPSG